MSDEYTNILLNAVVPFDPRKTKLLMGSLEYIAAEVVVAKVVRKIIKADTVGWAQLAYVHAISLPFMGGAAAFFDQNIDYQGTDDKGKKIGFGQQFMDGAKGIPAVLLAQWIVASFTKGFHAPWFNMKDLFITAAAKAVTAPLLWTIHDYMPFIVQNGLQSNDILHEYQANRSRFTSVTTKRGKPSPFVEIKKK